jgi:hypothetical protein
MSEKTEKASAKKLQDARKKGEIAKSKDATSAAVFIVLLGLMWAAGGAFMAAIQALLEVAIDAPAQVGSGKPWWLLLEQLARDAAKVVLPVLIAAVVAAVLAGFAQVRGVFSFEPMQFKPAHRRRGSQAPAANDAAIAAPMPNQCRRECGAADEACETETSELTRCASASGNSGSAWRSHAVR